MKKGFTLAEVLITLGIIGIVAAMTLPTLVQNYKKKELVTKLQKVYTVMNQAINLAEVENGNFESWYPDCGASSITTCTIEGDKVWYDKYLAKHIKTTKVEKCDPNIENLCLYFADGSILAFAKWMNDVYFYTNKNAFLNPDDSKNRFLFHFSYNRDEAKLYPDKWKCMINKKFEPYCWNWNGTRDGLKSNGAYSAKLIQYDGWQIKDDYPFDFK